MKFKVAAVFSDNMVLQRDALINVFGEGENNCKVTVRLGDDEAQTTIINNKWAVKLPRRTAAENLTLSVKCGNEEKKFTNVAIGEVWLAGGQSNMELELQNCKNGKETLENNKNPHVRFYYTQKKCYIDDEFYASEENTCWNEFSAENAKCWSAVGYFFARELAAKLGVTVGVIGCNWGGTSASYWMSRESLERDSDLKTYLDEYDNAIAGKTIEQLKKEMDDYEAYTVQWQAKIDKFYAENPTGEWDDALKIAGECQYPGPLCPFNPFHATALYDSMWKRVCGYTMKGVIWYQGETDDCKPKMYFKLFREMIRLWRDDCGNDELPFVFVQLPMHRYKNDADFKNWCLIREAQMKIYNTTKNTGIAVAIDCGEFNEIHPKDKLPVGKRLCLQALYNVYDDKSVENEAFSPMFKEMFINGHTAEITFKHCDGLTVKGALSGFEIAGADKKFVPAGAEIAGNKVLVSAKEIAEPRFVRYLWTNYGEVTLFGTNGLPVAPFRTSQDDE